MVAGDIAVVVFENPTGLPPIEIIPDGETATVRVGGPFDLIGRGGDTPDKVGFETHGLVNCGKIAVRGREMERKIITDRWRD